jgi:hypothetical protein
MPRQGLRQRVAQAREQPPGVGGLGPGRRDGLREIPEGPGLRAVRVQTIGEAFDEVRGALPRLLGGERLLEFLEEPLAVLRRERAREIGVERAPGVGREVVQTEQEILQRLAFDRVQFAVGPGRGDQRASQSQVGVGRQGSTSG